MYVPGVEVANRGILLSFLVKNTCREEPSERPEAAQAIEMHMTMSCIAMGIIQSVSVYWGGRLSPNQLRYQRTASRRRVSETALMVQLRKYLFLFKEKLSDLRITQIIRKQQGASGIYWNPMAF